MYEALKSHYIIFWKIIHVRMVWIKVWISGFKSFIRHLYGIKPERKWAHKTEIRQERWYIKKEKNIGIAYVLQQTLKRCLGSYTANFLCVYLS